MNGPHPDVHDRGLQEDLKTLAAMEQRRKLLRWMAGVSVLPLLGCATNPIGNLGCATTPDETDGPFPGDGSNGANALALSGIVRSDIRESLGGSTGTAEGVPLTLNLTLVSSTGSCANLTGFAIYVWHCDREGLYSMYTIADQNYLRGVQETDGDGLVSFTTIFPGCYPGRAPHIHFEVYPNEGKATSAANKLKTSQLALPADVCRAVYATPGYEASVGALAQTPLEKDGVFSDGSSLQVANVTGSVSKGYVATLKIGILAT